MISEKKIVYNLILLSIIIDVLNGIIFRVTEGLSLSIFYKGFYLIVILYICLIRGCISKTSLLSFLLFIPVTYHLLNSKLNLTEVQWTLRIITLSLTIDYIITSIDSNKIKKYFLLAFLTLMVSIFLWVLFGLGYNQYSKEGIGTRGFFVAGNELGILHLTISFYWLRKSILTKNFRRYTFFGLVSLMMALMFATKVAVLGIIIIFGLLPFTLIEFKIPNLRRVKLLAVRLYFGVLFFLIAVVPLALNFLLKNIGLGKRINYWLERVDVVTVFFSGRNLLARELFGNIIPNLPGIEWLLGPGLYQINNSIGRSIEIDIIDFFIFFGAFGLSVYISLFWKIFRISQTTVNPTIKKANLLFLALLLFISNTAGHVITGGLSLFAISLIFATNES